MPVTKKIGSFTRLLSSLRYKSSEYDGGQMITHAIEIMIIVLFASRGFGMLILCIEGEGFVLLTDVCLA